MALAVEGSTKIMFSTPISYFMINFIAVALRHTELFGYVWFSLVIIVDPGFQKL